MGRASWIGFALLGIGAWLWTGCPADQDDDSAGDDDAADDDAADDDAADDDDADDDAADDDAGDDDTTVETVDAYVIEGEITWSLDFDADAEAAGYGDCDYTRTYGGVQFLDQPYLCPGCSVQLEGEAVMTVGFAECYELVFGGTDTRPEWWSLDWSEVDGDGALFFRSAAANLCHSSELTTIDAITAGTPFALEWDSEYALSDLGLPDDGVMALSATGSATLTKDPGTQIANPWVPRTAPYDCGWPLGNPGTLTTDFVLAEDATFPTAWLEDPCGELVDLWDFTGRYLVLDSTQPDCGPCLQMAQGAGDFLTEMDGLGIPTVFVSMLGEGLSNVIGEPTQQAFDSYVSTHGTAGEPILKDRGFGYAIFEPYHQDDLGYPTWAIVRPDMTVLQVGKGFSSWDSFRDAIVADQP